MTAARPNPAVLLLCLALASGATAAAAAPSPGRIAGSPLALASVPRDPGQRLAARLEQATGHADAGGHEDWLAQRVVTREWGASDDTSYLEIEVPGYRSEGWALVLSSIVPGAGELYVG